MTTHKEGVRFRLWIFDSEYIQIVTTVFLNPGTVLEKGLGLALQSVEVVGHMNQMHGLLIPLNLYPDLFNQGHAVLDVLSLGNVLIPQTTVQD